MRIQRLFDDGSPLILATTQQPGEKREALVVRDYYCSNADCLCRKIALSLHRVRWTAGGDPILDDSARAELSVDTGAIKLSAGFQINAASDEILALARALMGKDYVKLLQRRWSRVRAQKMTDEWRHVDWAVIDRGAMVPYHQAFPSHFDLSVVADGSRYWLVDYWCLNPDCSCDETSIDFVGENGAIAGGVRVRVGSMSCVDGEAAQMPKDRRALGRTLWKAFADERGRRGLRTRWKRMRKVARALPSHLNAPAVSPARGGKPGRNASCPCGSGKKFKRCCGR